MKLPAWPHLVLPFLVLLGLSGCTTPGGTPPAPPAPEASAAPPSRSPEWRHTATRDFERDFPGKGLGVSRRYDGEDGWIDITIYDLGRTWQDGCADPEFTAAFEAACDDIRAAAAAGYYGHLIAEPARSGTAGPLPMRWAKFTYRHQSRSIESYLLMTCARGRLIKARASLFVPVPPTAWDSIRTLLHEQVRLIR